MRKQRRDCVLNMLHVSKIAWLLGFNEVSAFTHTFKRWTGIFYRDARSGRRHQAPDVCRGAAEIPVVLSPEEVARFLEAAPGVKYKAAFSAAYGAGLRVSEVAALKVSDIDSERMLLRIEQGKGRKGRHAMLSPVLLELLRDWWRIARPKAWLFPGRDPLQPMSTRQLTDQVVRL